MVFADGGAFLTQPVLETSMMGAAS
jgi:hypothetical protein